RTEISNRSVIAETAAAPQTAGCRKVWIPRRLAPWALEPNSLPRCAKKENSWDPLHLASGSSSVHRQADRAITKLCPASSYRDGERALARRIAPAHRGGGGIEPRP